MHKCANRNKYDYLNRRSKSEIKCIHFPLTLHMISGNCQTQEKTAKPFPAEKIKIYIMEEWISQMLSPILKDSKHFSNSHEILFFWNG